MLTQFNKTSPRQFPSDRFLKAFSPMLREIKVPTNWISWFFSAACFFIKSHRKGSRRWRRKSYSINLCNIKKHFWLFSLCDGGDERRKQRWRAKSVLDDNWYGGNWVFPNGRRNGNCEQAVINWSTRLWDNKGNLIKFRLFSPLYDRWSRRRRREKNADVKRWMAGICLCRYTHLTSSIIYVTH